MGSASVRPKLPVAGYPALGCATQAPPETRKRGVVVPPVVSGWVTTNASPAPLTAMERMESPAGRLVAISVHTVPGPAAAAAVVVQTRWSPVTQYKTSGSRG